MGTRLKPDFQPCEQVYKLLQPMIGTMELTREFVGHELGVFRLHFEGRTDAKASKTNWDTACYNWMKQTLEDKKHIVANARSFGGGVQANLFQAVAATLIASDLPSPTNTRRKPLRIQHTPIPGEGETLCADDALDQLARMRRGRS